MEKPRKNRMRRWLVVALALFALYFGPAFVALQIMGGDESENANADCIFVPGMAAMNSGKPEQGLLARLERARDLYKEGRAPLIVVSGGSKGGANESKIMAQWLQENGVPPSAIIRESESRSTRENATLSAPLMRKRGIKTALIVSQSMHLPRVGICLRDEDFETINAPSKSPPISAAIWPTTREAFLMPLHAARIDRWFN